MSVELRAEPFDPWRELPAWQARALAPGSHGATAAFVGTMRDFNDDDAVTSMFLEHYPGMTERALEAIVTEQVTAEGLLGALVIHRVGTITPGEPIVLVAVWSAHRREAFTACRAIMEALKSKAPFWKREERASGSRWVERNTPG